MDERFRILRVVMASAALLLLVKAMAVVTGADAFVTALVGTKAAQAEEKSHTSTTPPPEASLSAPPAAEHAAADQKPVPAEAAAPPAQVATATEPVSAPVVASREGQSLTRSEIDVLENLSKRRIELDQRARDLDLREKLLVATEQRIDGRIAELKGIQASIQGLLGNRDAAQEAQLAGIVKVYETMKPKDAARIFDELDIGILLPVAQKMKSSKFAPILANMDPTAAKRLTVALATHLDAPPSAAAPAPQQGG